MPHSLKNKIKSLCYKGEITENERDRIIKALEQKPCEDCISRQMAIDVVRKWFDKIQLNGDICLDGIRSLPSVTPQQPCEEENPNCTECRYYDKEKHHCPRFCQVIENTMAEITSEQARWIPCSERLPERDENVLTYHRNESFDYQYVSWIDDYSGKWAGFIGNLSDEVLAWMPLPEGYKEEDE